jgi:hypothetical protein
LIPASKPGYRQFMSGFADYARENGIHIHGGRGSFARKAGEIWKDLKGKPAWNENLDVVLPQYLEKEEGFGAGPLPKISIEERQSNIIEELGTNQFEWWNVKSLYGLWSESVYVYPDRDRLFVIDTDGLPVEISQDELSFALYRALKDSVDNNLIDEYSYIQFEATEINDNNGIDLVFSLTESTEYRKQLFDTTTYQWSEQVKEKYALQKEALGEKGAAKLARTRINLPGAAKREAEGITTKEGTQKTKQAVKKLEKLNEAIDKLESQYERGLITKAEYKKYLNKLYKL